MALALTVGNQTFQFPIEGTKPGWGEEVSSWAQAVTDVLTGLFGPHDISNTAVTIANNISTATNVGAGATALFFPPTAVRSFVVTYAVTRDSSVESGTMEGFYNGVDWDFFHSHIGNAGVDFQITSAGQVQYFSTDDVSGIIRFRASTIDYV